LPRVSGRMSGAGKLDWTADPQASRLRVALDHASIDDLRVMEPVTKPGSRPAQAASLKRVSVANVAVDVPARQLSVGEVRLQQPSLSLERDEQGTWNVQRWVPAAVPLASASLAASGASSHLPWKTSFKTVVLEAGRLGLSDASSSNSAMTVRTEVTALALDIHDLVWEGDRPAPLAKVKLRARVGDGDLAFNGEVGLAYRMASGTVAATRFPIHAFAPLVTLAPRVVLARADAGFKGNLTVRVPDDGMEATSTAMCY